MFYIRQLVTSDCHTRQQLVCKAEFIECLLELLDYDAPVNNSICHQLFKTYSEIKPECLLTSQEIDEVCTTEFINAKYDHCISFILSHNLKARNF